MNFCNLKDLQETPLTYKDNNAIFMDNSRDFTIYKPLHFYLQQVAEKYNLKLNSNEFRLFLQNNPNKLSNFINLDKAQDIIYLPQK